MRKQIKYEEKAIYKIAFIQIIKLIRKGDSKIKMTPSPKDFVGLKWILNVYRLFGHTFRGALVSNEEALNLKWTIGLITWEVISTLLIFGSMSNYRGNNIARQNIAVIISRGKISP